MKHLSKVHILAAVRIYNTTKFSGKSVKIDKMMNLEFLNMKSLSRGGRKTDIHTFQDKGLVAKYFYI